MNHYDTYLFDWDGTLARTLEIWLEEIKKNYEAHGLTISDADNARHFGDLRSPLLYGLPEEKLPQFLKLIEAEVMPRLPRVELYDNSLPVLNALQARGKKLGLVTTALPEVLHPALQRHNIGHFGAIVAQHDVRAHKPDPEGIHLAMQQLGADPARTIMIGDSAKDLAAARNAGIDSLLFYPNSHAFLYSLDDLHTHQPKYTITAWQELLDQLQ